MNEVPPDRRPEALKDDSLPRVLLGASIALVWPPGHLVAQQGQPWLEHMCVTGDGTRILDTVPLNPGHLVAGQPPDPVSVNPSILCQLCGLHGFVRHSEWVPA